MLVVMFSTAQEPGDGIGKLVMTNRSSGANGASLRRCIQTRQRQTFSFCGKPECNQPMELPVASSTKHGPISQFVVGNPRQRNSTSFLKLMLVMSLFLTSMN